jgi:predicted DNA-binding transcriptional regulator YafY
MPINKNALIRYKVLDNCFRNSGRRYYIEDLISECNKVLKEINPDSKGISRRQIFEDISFMESSEGWSVDIFRGKDDRRAYYRYVDPNFSINNIPLNELDIIRLQTILQTITQFKGMPQFEWMYELFSKMKQGISASANTQIIVEFDSNQYLWGIEYFGIIYNSILYNKVLKIRYCPFICEEAYELILHPYYLKQYNNRWFVFGYNPQKEKFDWILALDRIKEIKETNLTYIQNTQIEWTEYFEDMIGVSKPENAKIEKIVLHFFNKSGKYIESKPIHGSQKSKWIEKDVLEVSLELIINYELTSLILSYADNVRVIHPQSFEILIKERMRKGFVQYEW